MKNILCPTDFSEQANHAVEAGFYLAKKFSAALHLFHVVESQEEMDFNISGGSGNIDAVQDIFFLKLLEVTKERMSKLVATPGLEEINITSDIKIGKPSKFIFAEIDGGKHDLIIMGTKGASGLSEVLIGSNTERVVRRSRIPVLAVKNFVDESNFQSIVYASSFSDDEHEVIAGVKHIQEAFSAKLHMLRVNTPDDFKADWDTRKTMEEFVEKYDIQNHTFNIYNDTIEEDGIMYFAEEVDAGMIAMATHGRTGIANLLSGSIAEDVVNHAKRPVLTYNLND